MSTNVGIAGFSLKLNEDDQSKERITEISKSFGYKFENEDEFDDVLYSNSEEYLSKWKPHVDYNGKYGFFYLKSYEYDAFDIEHYTSITDMGKQLKDFIEKTGIMPKESIKSFAILYYNGSDCPFKY